MGATHWSNDHYEEKAAARAIKGIDAFEHDADVKSGRASGVHNKMNPRDVKMRECRDSEAHPESHAVAVLFDVTGSMERVPRILQKSLPKLMGLLIKKSYLEHPAIMVGAIGDATCDFSPLQVGQFESGIEIEEDLSKLHLEGGGGGQKTESYELAMYFMARHTCADCYDKRKKKGYLFIIGDEMPYDKVKRAEVSKVLGESVQDDMPIEDLIKELETRWDVYFVIPNMTSHYDDKQVIGKWASLLGQNMMRLEDPAGICELIAGIVGVAEGKVDAEDVSDDLKELSTPAALIKSVTTALSPISKGKMARRKGAELSVRDSGAESGIEAI